jgi:hypothetical protein
VEKGVISAKISIAGFSTRQGTICREPKNSHWIHTTTLTDLPIDHVKKASAFDEETIKKNQTPP